MRAIPRLKGYIKTIRTLSSPAPKQTGIRLSESLNSEDHKPLLQTSDTLCVNLPQIIAQRGNANEGLISGGWRGG